MIKEERLEKIQELFRQHQGGRFEVESVLGIGGMGVVVRAQDTRLRVARAIKIFNPELNQHTDLLRRFENEASIMAGIDHPNIVKVYDIGEIQDHHFMILEWVDGGSLRGFLEASGAMHERVALEMTYRICEALSVAHKRNVIHRDIKPDNILITMEGVPKVTDFGIAHMDDTERKRLTATKDGMGSPGYMAPEQMSELASADARADVYAVAVTFWTFLTGCRPPGMLFFHDIEDSPELLAIIPECLRAIVKKAVSRKQEDRHQSIAEFVAALQSVEHELPVFNGKVTTSITTDQDIGVADPTALGVTKFALKTPMRVESEPEPTLIPHKASPMMVGGTLAYRPHVEFSDVAPLELVSEKKIEETTVPPIILKPHRSFLTIAIILCVAGVGGFLAVYLWSQGRHPETPVAQEHKSAVVITAPVEIMSPDVFVAAADVSMSTDVSLVEAETKGEPDVVIEDIQVRTEPIVEKPLEKLVGKEHKVSKLAKPVEVKAGENLVLKPESQKVKPPPIIDLPQLKPEVVKVSVGLDLPSGDTSRVWLSGPGGKKKIPGSVAPGTYKIVALFKEDEDEMTMPGTIEVKEGETIKLSCNSTFRKCRKL